MDNLEQKDKFIELEKNPESSPAEFLDSPEKSFEKDSGMSDSEHVSEGIFIPVGAQQTVGEPGIDITKSPLHQSVESILEDNLEDLFYSLDTKSQAEFKKKGEETTKEIIKLIESAKATVQKVFKLIRNWLASAPGVSKFFIEQEARIKTDKILDLNK